MDSIASAAIKYGSRRTRELFFEPLDLKFLIRSSMLLRSDDSRSAELQRLRPYYRGTRALAMLAVLTFIPPLLMPFAAPFVGFYGVIFLLAIYVGVFIAINVVGLFVEISLDAILAIKYERRISFYGAASAFFGYARANPWQAAEYMGAKLLIDMSLLTVTTLLYMPAMIVLLRVSIYLLHALIAGASGIAATAMLGFISVMLLILAATLISMIISVLASAFYGYYTEDAVRHIRKAERGTD